MFCMMAARLKKGTLSGSVSSAIVSEFGEDQNEC